MNAHQAGIPAVRRGALPLWSGVEDRRQGGHEAKAGKDWPKASPRSA